MYYLIKVLIIIALIIAGPAISVWAINCLLSAAYFGAPFVPHIAFTFWSWLAVVALYFTSVVKIKL